MKEFARVVGREVAKLAWLVLAVGAAGAGVAGCSATGDEPPVDGPLESVAAEQQALVTSGPACADGSIEDTFTGGIMGCSGAVTWDKRQNLCGHGYRPATSVEWAANAGVAPTHNYWTNDDLLWHGTGPSACYATMTMGNSCGTNSPMRVCTATGGDAEGNTCNFTNCGLNTNAPNKFFGGCVGNSTAGTLCIKSACADGSVEETFSNGMVGCAGNVKWDNRRALCSEGYRPATAKEWATLGATAPEHNYWTDDFLKWDGSGPNMCTVGMNAPNGCSADTPMLVCNPFGPDPEGHGCNWTGCGLDSNFPNRNFGGCPWTNSAGTLCVPEGCADGSVEQTLPNGMVACAGSAASAAAAAPLCAPGYRLVSDSEFNQIGHPEIRNSALAALNAPYWSQQTRRCQPGGCGGTTGGALCVPQRGCADGTVEQIMPDGFVGCAGAVTWANRDSLCARGYRTITSEEWRILNAFTVQVQPTHNYWTADNLKYNGSSSSCFVSTSVGTSCTAGRPMRLCTSNGSDAEGNVCGWTNCGINFTTPNRFFGGCNTGPTAGSVCVPDIPAANIVNGDSRLTSLIDFALDNAFRETPAMAIAVVADDKIYMAARGKRKATDTTNTLLVSDKFNQNSVSKTIAGTVSSRIVDQGTLSWSSTLGAVIPSIFPAPYPDYANVTLAELHAHASGFDFVAYSNNDNVYDGLFPAVERKRLYARDYTRDSPLFARGTGFRYGTGAVPAIAMSEQTLFQIPYDSLLQDFLFRPLMMKKSGTTADAWGHAVSVNSSGVVSVAPPAMPPNNANHAKLPVGGVAVSIEDLARYARATMYSPRHPVQYWSHKTQQSRVNNVGLSPISPSGWFLSVNNSTGGLQHWHNGWEGLNYSFVSVWPDRRVAVMGMTNCAQSGGGSLGRALDWVAGQLSSDAKLGEFGVPAPVFPHQDASSYLATTGTSSTNKPGDEADKAFDGNYDTYWAAADNVQSAWLKVTVPQQTFVGHVLVNEVGPFEKEALHPDLGIVTVKARSGDAVVAFRVTSYQLYLIDSSGTEWLAASGTTLGVNKLIPVNGHNVTGARLVMNTQFRGPVIKEMHLLPW